MTALTAPVASGAVAARPFPRFLLGTVQFGYAYGLARSRVQRDDAGRTLAVAWDAGIDMLDTAPVYGESEAVIGATRPAHADFKIVTKTMALRQPRIGEEDVARVIARARQSLELLRVPQIDSILVHESEDLLSVGSDRLVEALRRLVDEGIVRRIGVSVYDPDVLETIMSRHQIDVVQLPLNIFDQRFARDGYLANLTRRGVEVHTRSVLLQGVLLQTPEALPDQFRAASKPLARLREYARSLSLSPLEATMLFAGGQRGVSRLVIGIDGVESLEADIAAMNRAASFEGDADFSSFAIDDPLIIDPRKWKL